MHARAHWLSGSSGVLQQRDGAYDQKEEDHNQKFDEEQARTHPGIFFHRITGRAQDARHPPFESER